MRFFLYFLKILLTCFYFVFLSLNNTVYADDQWLHSSGNYQGHRYSDNKQINPQNIASLNKVWIFNSGKINTRNVVQATPIFIDNKLIIVDIYGGVYALNPENGKKIWYTKLNPPAGRRGITSTNGTTPKIYVSTKKSVVELNATTGEVLKTFKSGLSLLPPIINKNKIFIATLKNGVKSFDLITTELLWNYSLEFNNVTPRIWSGFSYDNITNSLFVVTSNPGGLYGGDRIDEDLSVSLISINADSGNKNWHFQHIRHDLWDYDLVGNPIIFSINKNNKSIRVVSALSKTGDLIYLKVKDGSLVFPKGVKKIKTPESDVFNEKVGNFQYIFSKPMPFTDIKVDLENDFNHLNKVENKKLFKIISNAKSGLYLPPSFNYNLILFGLHGGAEWPGGSYNKKDNSIVVPFNREPWVIRMEYKDKIFSTISNISKELYKTKIKLKSSYQIILNFLNINNTSEVLKTDNKTSIINPWELSSKHDSISKSLFSIVPYGGGNTFYENNCSSCHGIGREGFYENEFIGDKYVPSLVGIKIKNQNQSSYKYLKKIHNNVDIIFDFDEQYLLDSLSNFEKYDNFLNKFNLLKINGFWQNLLDKEGLPATNYPWGGIAKINMDNGNLVWKIPFGKRYNKNKELISIGDKNFGGVLSTSSDLIFATGTPDEKGRAFSSKDGKLLWETKLPYAGSAPPMTYTYLGCQYIIFTATGGQFVGFKEKGDATVAYKLNDCQN